LTEPGAESEFERARRAAGERALIAAAAGGSASAFETLYRSHVGKVYGLCLRMTANPTIAEDCAQDAFVQAWRSLPTFEARSSFGTWLHRIAVNAVLARGRRREESLGKEQSIEESVAETLADPASTPLRSCRPARARRWCSWGSMVTRTRKRRRCSGSPSEPASRSCIALASCSASA
jgi:RNA polymerase sigma factor (sigma-70 family)